MKFGKAVMGSLVALSVVAANTFAQDYPSRSIRIVVPFPPGGLADVLARMIGAKFTEAWKQPVMVDNRPGTVAASGARAD